jgi:hypothetical protein
LRGQLTCGDTLAVATWRETDALSDRALRDARRVSVAQQVEDQEHCTANTYATVEPLVSDPPTEQVHPVQGRQERLVASLS